MDNLFSRLRSGRQAFCLIQKQDSDDLLLLTGRSRRSRLLRDIPRRRGPSGGGRVYDTISIVPFCQIREKGGYAHDAGEEILTIEVTGQQWIAVDELPAQAAQVRPIAMTEAIRYDTTAEEYAAVISRVIDREIGNGEGANFVIPRNAAGRIAGFSLDTALTIFANLLANDYGTYWKFLFTHEDRVFIGSTPERHLSVEKGRVRMNPISGTFRKKAGHQSRSQFKDDLLAFINDRKEINELFMVVDEELKMMARMCEKGGAIIGPLLKEMSRLIHSEYLLAGDSDKDIFELFRDSMFAATVVGSPVENACTVIARYTGRSRRYYGSALLLVGRDEDGGDFLDSPITIRTAEIEYDGSLHLSVGATLVRDSIPAEEVRETEAKAAAILAGILGDGSAAVPPPLLPRLASDDDIIEGLLARNEDLSHFWFFRQGRQEQPAPARPLRLTLIHNEDDFIYMLRHILQALGMQTAIVPWSCYEIDRDDADITLVGPGPGNPNDDHSRKIAGIMNVVQGLLQRRRPALCICLGHQILCRALGLAVEKRGAPLQGSQEEIDLFGRKEKVGFYNTFAAKKGKTAGEFAVSILPGSDEVIAIRGDCFSGFQFHPESILSRNGCDILREEIERLLRCRRSSPMGQEYDLGKGGVIRAVPARSTSYPAEP